MNPQIRRRTDLLAICHGDINAAEKAEAWVLQGIDAKDANDCGCGSGRQQAKQAKMLAKLEFLRNQFDVVWPDYPEKANITVAQALFSASRRSKYVAESIGLKVDEVVTVNTLLEWLAAD